MIVCLEDVIDSARLKGLVTVLDNPALYEAGVRTAGRVAKPVKSNLQGDKSQPEVSTVVDKVRHDLLQHSVFRRFALPLRIGRMMVSCYEPGMAYGTHFDDAFIDGARTDLSFTVFLSEPDSYTGGELQLTTATGEQAIKLPAGCAIVYPSDHLHQVLPVTSGRRLAIVGWVQSRIRSSQNRQLLFELFDATESLAGQTEDQAAIMRLRYIHNNLLRQWGES